MKRNTESVSYGFETDFVFRFIKKFANFFKNGIQNPFHTVLKRILYSVSHTFSIPNNPFKQIQFTKTYGGMKANLTEIPLRRARLLLRRTSNQPSITIIIIIMRDRINKTMYE